MEHSSQARLFTIEDRDVLGNVLSYLDNKDLGRVAQVCGVAQQAVKQMPMTRGQQRAVLEGRRHHHQKARKHYIELSFNTIIAISWVVVIPCAGGVLTGFGAGMSAIMLTTGIALLAVGTIATLGCMATCGWAFYKMVEHDGEAVRLHKMAEEIRHEMGRVIN